MAKRKISLLKLVLAFVVGIGIAFGIKALVHWGARSVRPTVASQDLPAEQTTRIDFFQAAGVERQDVDTFLVKAEQQGASGEYPLLLTLQNGDGDYLANGPVKVVWAEGEERLQIGNSGVLSVSLSRAKLPGLTLVVPKDYTVLRQMTIPLGPAYQPMEKPDTSSLPYRVIWDREIQDALRRELNRLALVGGGPRGNELRRQLRRTTAPIQLPPAGGEEMTPTEIYRQRSDAVVVVASLLPGGVIAKGGGCVLDGSGIVATAFHVIDKPDALAHAVMTASGKVYPVVEVLAARRSADVAILKIDAEGLRFAPLSAGDPEGSLVTLISHPQDRFYSLTEGCICRYSTSVLFGETIVRMAVTAEFADGSSGSPLLNSRGEVTGIVSFTSAPDDQMVHRVCTPVAEIHRLIEKPAAP